MTDDESGTQSERPLTDQERAELYREQLKELHVTDLVRDMMVTLVTIGYEKLGLTDQTRDLRDLTDARVAIESLRRLIEVVEGEGDPEAATLRSTLAQMQLNFARASAESRAAAPAAPRDAAPAEPRSAPQQAAPASGAPPQQAAPKSGAAGPAKEPSEAESRPGVEAEAEAQKAPAAPAPRKKAASAQPTSGSAARQTPRKARAKKAASPAKKAASPRKAPRKKRSGGGTPPGV